MKILKILANATMIAFVVLVALPLNSEAKTISYSGLTIVHNGVSIRNDSSYPYGIGSSQNHNMSITSKETTITINPFSTPINRTKSSHFSNTQLYERWNEGTGNFPLTVTPSVPNPFIYTDTTPLMAFKIGNDKSPTVVPNVSSKKMVFSGYTFKNLVPNKQYTITYDDFALGYFLGYPYYYSPGFIGDGPLSGSTIQRPSTLQEPDQMEFITYTKAARPIISVSDIKDVRVTISWNTNGNPTGTNYTLQRRLNASQTWTDIYTGTANQYTNTNLVPETKYQYRVRVNHIAGEDWNTYSYQGGLEYIEVSTTADPAVAAAQEAASKAQAAKEAAEQTLQYSIDAKTAAESVKTEVDHPDYGLKALNSKINNTTPYIQRIYNPKGATLTLEQTFDIKINAAGVQENLVYRVICDTFDSGWTKDNLITITGLTRDGTKKATVIVSNNPAVPENGATVEDEFIFFKVGF